MASTDFFQRYMPGDVCFGCGHSNPDGLRIKSYWEGEDCVCRWQPDERYQGWSNLTCGGIIATLIDCHSMASAMATSVRREGRELGTEPHYRFATGTLNIRFLKPTPIAQPLELKARVTDIKNDRQYTVHCDVYSAGEKTVEADVIAFLVYRSDRPGDSPFGG